MKNLNTLKKTEGFTLIELLVVIAIIGLLAGIVLVSLGGARESGQDARRLSDIRNISTAMELCGQDATCGAGPFLYLPAPGPGAPAGGIPTYMPVIPNDPTTGLLLRWT